MPDIEFSRESIRGWRLFSPLLVRELSRVPVLLYWFGWQKPSPSIHDLPRHLRLASSSSVDCITHLAIHKVWMFHASDLMALAEMPNLGILELSDLFGEEQRNTEAIEVDPIDSVLNDRLVRGWSEKDEPFPNLRVLLMTSVHSSTTLLALQYASRFPSLVCCALRSVSLLSNYSEALEKAGRLGWRLERTLNPWIGIDDSFPVIQSGDYIHPGRQTRQRSCRSNEMQMKAFEESQTAGVFLTPYCKAGPHGQEQHDRPPETTKSGSVAVDSQSDHEDGLDRPRYSFPWRMSGWSLYSALGEQIGNADLLGQGVSLQQRATYLGSPVGCRDDRNGHYYDDKPYSDWQEVLPPKPMLNIVLGSPRKDYPDLQDTVYRPGNYQHSLERHERRVTGITVWMNEDTFVREHTSTLPTATKAGAANVANTTGAKDTECTKKADVTNTSTKRKEAGRSVTFRPRKRRDLNDLFSYGVESKRGSQPLRHLSIEPAMEAKCSLPRQGGGFNNSTECVMNTRAFALAHGERDC